MSKAIIHIGYPKAASTWLQKNVFPTVKNATPVLKNDITRYFVETFYTEFSPEKAKELLPESETLLLSDERFIGGMLTGGLNGFAVRCIAERFKETFDEVQIIMVIRNQLDIIASTYAHYVYYGGTYNFKKFYLNPEYYVIQKMALFSPHLYDYYKIYKTYKSLFGKDNVAVLLYEDIINSPSEFISQIETETGLYFDKEKINLAETNTGKSYKDIQIQRIINRFLKLNLAYKHYFVNLLRTRPEKIDVRFFKKEKNRTEKIIPEKLRKDIKSRFETSNNKLFELLGIDKAKYGYP